MTKKEQVFVETVWTYYQHNGRHSLPWRTTRNPYRICVSEVMLQQTQVDRVLPKYKEFVKVFPSVYTLARAPLVSVLRVWQGLGYNRRAKLLHECARVVTECHAGRFPRTYESLVALPGIGPYTAGAIMAFAYNEPYPMIETNIRAVYIHHFFAATDTVSDVAIRTLIIRTLDHANPRAWYSALMDYGAHLKKTIGNPNIQSKHYTKQTPFKGSDREIRGAIMRALLLRPDTLRGLMRQLVFPSHRIHEQLEKLMYEGFIVRKENKLWIQS